MSARLRRFLEYRVRWWAPLLGIGLAWALAAVAGLLASGCSALGGGGLASDPWYAVGAEAELVAVNATSETCLVHVVAADSAIRVLGSVAAGDSAAWTLRFADQRVTVVACGTPHEIDVKRPTRHRLVLEGGTP